MRTTVFLLAAVICAASAHGTNSRDFLAARADSFHTRYQYDSAVALGQQALESGSENGVDSVLGLIHFIIGDSHYRLANFEESELHLARALEIQSQVLGSEHLSFAETLNSLGHVFSYLRKIDSAIAIYERSRAIREAVVGSEHSLVGRSLNNLAIVWSKKGDYRRAQSCYDRALEIEKNCPEPDARLISIYSNNLGTIYLERGSFGKAASLYTHLLAEAENTLGREDIRITSYIDNLVVAHMRNGSYNLAELPARRAVKIKQENLGRDHPETALSMHNLGTCLKGLKRLEEALVILKEVVDIRTRSLGNPNPLLSSSIIEIAQIYMDLGRLDEAGALLLGNEHPMVPQNLLHFSRYQLLTHDVDAAFKSSLEAYTLFSQHFRSDAQVMPEHEVLEYSRYLRIATGYLLEAFLSEENPTIKQLASLAEVILKTKGAVSDQVYYRWRTLSEIDEKPVRDILTSYRQITQTLSSLHASGSDGKSGDRFNELSDSLRIEKDRIEKNLLLASATARRSKEVSELGTDDLIGALPARTALVEYYRVNLRWILPESEPFYVVLVIDSSLYLRRIGNAAAIDSLVSAYRRHMSRVSMAGGRVSQEDMQEYHSLARSLYEIIWLPVEGRLSGCESILLSPDGQLNLLSFAGLVSPQGEYLVEQKSLHYLSAGRDLIRGQDHQLSGSGFLIMGDPDYDAGRESINVHYSSGGTTDGDRQNAAYAGTNREVSDDVNCDPLKERELARLPGTRIEIDLVQDLLRESGHLDVSVRFGHEATESEFKIQAPGKRVIHLATHGYYAPPSCWSGQSGAASFAESNPLLLSGLFLAGANRKSESPFEIGYEDGILSAAEVSTMDLRGVRWVILSACETALGVVESGEGVYGLRKAFQVAGVETVISSLWPVTDQMSIPVIRQLYHNLNAPPSETIRSYQLSTIDQLRSNGYSDHPYRWSAFISIGRQ